MLHNFFQQAILFFSNHYFLALLLVFFSTFSEALAVIGTIVPGSVILTWVGFLVGSKVIPIYDAIIVAAIGAITGDLASFVIGKCLKEKLSFIWPFSKCQNLLAKSRSFCKKHGGKSVVIGRFFGPCRSMIPLIVGALGLTTSKFLIAAIPSATVWAISYMLPGMIVGALSMEFPKEVGIEICFYLILFGLIAIIIYWLSKIIAHYFSLSINKLVKNLSTNLPKSRRYRFLYNVLLSRENSLEAINYNYSQLFIFGCLLVTGILFIFFVLFVSAHHALLGSINEHLYFFVLNLKAAFLDKISLFFTTFSSNTLKIVFVGLLSLTFLTFRRFKLFFTLSVLCGSYVAITLFLKHLIQFPRPYFLINTIDFVKNSFPSGHVGFFMSIFGFLALYFTKNLNFQKQFWAYFSVVILSIIIAFSRMELGFHWFSDVAGGLILGIFLSLLFTLIIRRLELSNNPPNKNLFLASTSIFLISLAISCYHDFPAKKADIWPTYQLSSMETFADPESIIPLFRTNRFGRFSEVFNLRVLTTNLPRLKNKLLADGWHEESVNFSFRNLLLRLIKNRLDNLYIPIFSQLYETRLPELFLTKKESKNTLILRIWATNFTVGDKKVYLGAINFYQNPEKFLLKSVHFKKGRFLYGAIPSFLKNVALPLNLKVKLIDVTEEKFIDWNQKLLLIYE